MGITTTTSAGRVQLAHPDLAHDGGSGLWTKVHTMFQKIGDSLSIQYFGEYTVANSGTQDVTHNFDMNLTELDVRIVENDVIISQDEQATYGIAEKVGNTKNALTITNNTGTSKTFAVYVMGFSLDKLLGRVKNRTVTTDATQTTIATVQLPNNESCAFSWLVSAKKDGTTSNFYEIKGIAENNAGTASVRIVSQLVDEDDTDWDATVTVDGANLRFKITGESSTTIEWYSVIQKTYF